MIILSCNISFENREHKEIKILSDKLKKNLEEDFIALDTA
jgi:hypothetical protein